MWSTPWRKKLHITIVLGLILSILVGCTGAAPAAPAPAAGDTTAPVAEQVSTANLTPAESAARSIPRNRTLVLSRAGTTIQDFQQMNPYSLGGLGRVRDTLNKTVYEFLFYYNHNSGEITPWLATGYEYNDNFTEINITLREGVTWSDGEPFTAADVEYTLEMIRDTPTLVFSAQMQEWIKDVEVQDDLTFRIILNKPNPRWVFSFLAENSEINLALLPKHIWENEDPDTFTNFDLEKGWPVGTGPFRLVRSTELQLVFDRRDNWWAAETGFATLPQVERIIRIPGGDAAGIARLFAQSEVDFGGALQKGDFEAARGRNPNLVSWNAEGPVWGTADACTYILGMNNKAEPFNNRDVRWAVNHALDRSRLVTLAYEDSTEPMVVPLSTFGGVLRYMDQIQDLIDQYQVDNFDLDKVNELMSGAGYSKDSEGFWAKDGTRLEVTVSSVGGLRPLGPPLAQQLRDAGFDALVKHDDTGQITANVRDGTQLIWLDPHCGAAQEPYPTFSHFHSKFSAPIGQTTGFRWANTRYENPEYDAILDKMEAMQPSAEDAQYVELFRQAADIWLNDLPEIVIAEERHVWTYNATCWQGWPNAENPYIAPYDVWGAFMLAVLNLEPTGRC
jgi:peptide/nickel transport system substrate-binding protein